MSNTRVVKALLIDDLEEDLRYAQRLTRDGLVCTPLRANLSLDRLRYTLRTALDQRAYDVVILDYRLDDQGPPAEPDAVSYRGGTIAAELKEQFPDRPVVLLTTEQKLKDWLVDKPRVRELFDLQILKGDLARPSQRREAARKVVDLFRGYESITSEQLSNAAGGDRWSLVQRLLGASDGETELLPRFREGGPPRSVSEIVAWVLRELLRFPGILMDRNETRTRLRLTQSGFDRPEVQSWLQSARYTGIFSMQRAHWWRPRIESMIATFRRSGDAPIELSKAIARAVNVKSLRPARCVWCGSLEVARPCNCCQEAVDASHCLAVFLDGRPDWADAAVVCFRCIQDGRAEEIRFMPGSDDVYEMLRLGQIDRPRLEQ